MDATCALSDVVGDGEWFENGGISDMLHPPSSLPPSRTDLLSLTLGIRRIWSSLRRPNVLLERSSRCEYFVLELTMVRAMRMSQTIFLSPEVGTLSV